MLYKPLGKSELEKAELIASFTAETGVAEPLAEATETD